MTAQLRAYRDCGAELEGIVAEYAAVKVRGGEAVGRAKLVSWPCSVRSMTDGGVRRMCVQAVLSDSRRRWGGGGVAQAAIARLEHDLERFQELEEEDAAG